MSWQERAEGVRWNVAPFIEGRYRPSKSDRVIDNLNPATETPLCETAEGDAEDVDEAVKSARRRFDEGAWSQMPVEQRSRVLMNLAELLVQHKADVALLDTLEMGKPIQASLHDAEVFAPKFLRSAAALADQLLGAAAPISRGTFAMNTYEPRGVVGLITPWNFPIVNAAIKLGPALAAGNSVVLKPSEIAASSALKLAELALDAGIPAGVFNVVPGLGSTAGAALALHPDIDLVSFTGSTLTGRRVMEMAARSNGKPVILECGGKSPQIVFEDVHELERVADATVESAFWNEGQVCSARTRLLVHESLQEALTSEIVKRAQRIRPADPLDEHTTFGPLASAAQRDRVRGYIERSEQSGARARLRGEVRASGGCYVSPTVFDRVDARMAVAREEIFGPVLCVQSFATDEEALALANGTEYGLAATVWTRDMGRAKRFAWALRSGSVSVRTGAAEVPSGHVLSCEPQKASGFGFEIGLRALEAHSTLKAVTFLGL